MILRAVNLGEPIGPAPATRPRSLDQWEIRIWPDGTVQEARGYQGREGVLPPRNIGAAAARQIIDAARPIASLPEHLGRYVTDTSYHEIEIASGTSRHSVSSLPMKVPDAEAEQYEQIWTSIAGHFPEPTVCRGCKEWSCREQP